MTIQEIPGVMTAKRNSLAVLFGFISVVSVALLLVGLDSPSAALAPPVPLDYVVAEQRSVRVAVSVGGSVVPTKSVTLSAQAPGRVLALAGGEGDRFQTGDVLLELDDREVQAQLEAAYAQLNNASAALRNAEVQYQREMVNPSLGGGGQSPGAMGMFDKMFTPMSGMMGGQQTGVNRGASLHAAGSRVEQAAGAVQQAESQIRQIEARQRDIISKAPFDGVIIAKLAEIGDTVQPGQPLLEYADTEGLEIQVDMPQRLASTIQEGAYLPARLDVKEDRLNARVTRIFPVADPQRHTVTVKLSLPQGVEAAAGMYAEVMVPDQATGAASTLVIPASAVVKRSGLPMVYVVNDTGEAELRMIRLGDQVDETQVTILSGLQVGDKVIPSPGARKPVS